MIRIWIAYSIPLIIWLGSYVHLAVYHKQWNLFHVLIHESGRYTLKGTMFYFNHFLRELIIDTLYILCLYWSYLAIRPDAAFAGSHAMRILAPIGLAVFLVFVVIASIRKVGAKNATEDLLQYRELDTVSEFGSHWNMHFLSTIALMLMFVFPGLLISFDHPWLFVGIFTVFIVLSFIYRTDLKAVTDKRWLMHGAREIATFFLLYGLPFLIIFWDELAAGLTGIRPGALIAGGLILFLALWYVFAYLRSDVLDLAQGDFGKVYLMTSHFFEHFLDEIYLILLFITLMAWSSV